MTDDRKILVIDIEFAPAVAYVWRMWDENISPDQLIDHGGMLCFCAHWVGSRELLKELGSDLALEMSSRTLENFASGYDKFEAENMPSRRAARAVYAKARTGIFKRDVKG